MFSLLLKDLISDFNIYMYANGKSLATPDCFAPYLVNVTTNEYCSIYLETAFISEELCMNILVVIAAAEY